MSSSDPSIVMFQVDTWSASLAACRFGADDRDPDLLALIGSVERLKDACAALQARATHEYSERRLATLTLGSKPDRDARRDIAAHIARARRVSPTHGTRYLELSRMLVRDLPCTLDSLSAGQTSEYRAGLVAHAAACLGAADRAALDADLGPRLTGKGNRAMQGKADRIAAELDAAAVAERHRRAEKDRRVTLRPAPDTMTYLTALLPVADGVAAWAALDRHATLAKSGGDRRSRGQIMADELGHRLLRGTAVDMTSTDPTSATAPSALAPAVTPTDCRVPRPQPGARMAPLDAALCEELNETNAPMERPTPVTVDTATEEATGERTDKPDPALGAPSTPGLPPVRQIDLMLVMTDRTLFDGADTAAVIPGFGPVPAALARGMLADADPATRVFLRRLYTDPTGEQLLSADARGQVVPARRAAVRAGAGSALPHAVLRRPHPAHRPHRAPLGRRSDPSRQRGRLVRTVQPDESSSHGPGGAARPAATAAPVDAVGCRSGGRRRCPVTTVLVPGHRRQPARRRVSPTGRVLTRRPGSVLRVPLGLVR